MRNLQRILITQVDKARLQVAIGRALLQRSESRSRIDDLQRELDRAEVVDPTLMPSGLVAMNSTVRLRDLDTDEIETYTLVFPQEADIERNRISVLAPVGTAIIGYQVGDVVTWSVPRGRVQLRIEDVIAASPLPEGQTIGAMLCQT
jgi:regulator of nucleoside diphosphate kinase